MSMGQTGSKEELGNRAARKIAVTGVGYWPEGLADLEEAGYELWKLGEVNWDEMGDEAFSGLVGYVHGGNEYLDEVFFSRAHDMVCVGFLGSGFTNYIDGAAAERHGVKVASTPDGLTNAVAEHTVGMILDQTRALLATNVGSDGTSLVAVGETRELAELEVGVIGLGRIGRRIAEMLTLGFDCPVSYWSRTRREVEEQRLGISYKSLDELVKSSDVLVVMVALDDETRYMVDAALLGKAKPGVIVINTSTPMLVDPAALAEALASGQVASAAFDGLHPASTPGLEALEAWLGTEKLAVTRHAAWQTSRAAKQMTISAVHQLIEAFA